MNARNDIKRRFEQRLAAVRLRFAARVDILVARWLARCAANIEVAQRLFEADRKATGEFGMGVGLRVFDR